MKRIRPESALLFLSLILCARAAAAERALSPEEELRSFHLADSNLVIELVAAEPDVLSPVAIAWDASGSMFVAEMTDYPLGPGTGRIRKLDFLGAGRYGNARLYAADLPFPNGVMPWRNGLLVTAAPDIWFLSDTNADGVGDLRRRLLTGFSEGNQQLRVNGLFWGIDNWIYGANGRSDGEVRWIDATGRTNPAPPISIRRRDFRFRPDEGRFEAVAGNSQFGTAHDDWGNRFPVFNNIPLRQVVAEDHYFNRAPILLNGRENVVPIAAEGDIGRVFGLSPPLLMIPQPVGFFTSACGSSIFRGTALPDTYRGNAFICEPVQNVVTRRRLVAKGAVFVAERTENGAEFLASTDPWFHGVFTATGPDGALYVVDFYRKFVEHPHWVAEHLKETVPWRTGEGHGRIWRIRQKSGPPAASSPDLAKASTRELVRQLQDPNGWRRDTAQRLLVERGDRAAIDALQKLSRSATQPVARLHALYALDGLGALTRKILIDRLQDADARIRECAVRLTEKFSGKDAASFGGVLSRLANDADARVRFQVALTVGQTPNPDLATLLKLARRGAEDPWQANAILLGTAQHPWNFLRKMAKESPDFLRGEREGTLNFFEQMGSLIGSAGPEDQAPFITWLPANDSAPAALALFSGFGTGLAYRSRSWSDLASITGEPEKIAVQFWKKAGQAALSERTSPGLRLVSIRILARAKPEMAGDILGRLLTPAQPPNIQIASAQSFLNLDSPDAFREVLSRWSGYSRAVRRQLLSGSTRTPSLSVVLVDALEKGVVAPAEIEPVARQALLRHRDETLRERSRVLFQSQAETSRGDVVKKFEPALKLAGDRGRGGILFSKTCSVCHAVEGAGGNVGPDLSGIASHAPATLLVEILDPSRQILPDYMNYVLTTAKGETFSGLIAAESAAAVTLRRPAEPDRTVNRAQIKELKADGKSLMPDGLEQDWTAQDMADLLSFLRDPKKALLRLE